MTRSKSKTPLIVTHKLHAIYHRAATITPQYIDTVVRIHSGKHFIPLMVTQNHVGFKFGSFVRTRKRCKHKAKSKPKPTKRLVR